MNIIACVDDNMGLLFNNRRQSKDQAVVDKIYEIIQDKRLLVHEFSKNLFGDACEVMNNFLDIADCSDFCFVENLSVNDYAEKIDYVYLFRWNRNYPYDFQLELDFENYVLQKTEDIKGNSHEKITFEEWKRTKDI